MNKARHKRKKERKNKWTNEGIGTEVWGKEKRQQIKK